MNKNHKCSILYLSKVFCTILYLAKFVGTLVSAQNSYALVSAFFAFSRFLRTYAYIRQTMRCPAALTPQPVLADDLALLSNPFRNAILKRWSQNPHLHKLSLVLGFTWEPSLTEMPRCRNICTPLAEGRIRYIFISVKPQPQVDISSCLAVLDHL